MKIKTIKMGKKGEPSKVTVEMTLAEATYIAKFTGKQNGITANEILGGCGDEVNSEVYGALTGDFFNRFWDGGVDEAIRGL